MTTQKESVVHSVYVSSGQRDINVFPSHSDFTMNLPLVLTKVHGIKIRNYRYTPEPLINASNRYLNIHAIQGNSQITFDESITSIAKGDYSNSIINIIQSINTVASVFGVQFTFDALASRVSISFTNSGAYDTVHVTYNNLLKLLGFNTGVILYTQSASTPETVDGYVLAQDSLEATSAPRLFNDPNLILRITDVEAIMSGDSLTNRATAVLMSSRNNVASIQQYHDSYTPLLQVQHRLQRLRIQALNSYGDLYDITDENLTFQIDFHCYRDNDFMCA